LRPAGVSPPFFRAGLPTPVRFRFVHRAFAAAESFALVVADIVRLPVLSVALPPRSEASRFSRVSICRRTDSASSKFLNDMSMRCG
jgi:hypothetical protein